MEGKKGGLFLQDLTKDLEEKLAATGLIWTM